VVAVARRLSSIAAVGVVLAAAAPAAALALVPEDASRWAVTVRVGAQRPADLSPYLPGLGVGPSLELAGSCAALPWFKLELAAGWARSASPTTQFPVFPVSGSGVALQLSVKERLTTVPLTLGLRLAWPTPLRVRPYLIAGGGAVYAEYLFDAGAARTYSTGWGTEWCAGLGVETRVGTSLLLGLEARWRWAHATLRGPMGPSYSVYDDPSWEANLGSGSLQATVGWAF
jgi:hypothetical protein